MKNFIQQTIMIILLLGFISACSDDEMATPEGFEVMGGEGPYQFVYMDKKFTGKKVEQRRAGNQICKNAGAMEYCEVYFWSDRKDVQTSMPIKRAKVKRGVYSIKDGKVKLRALK